MSAGSLGSSDYEFRVRMEGFIAGLNAAKNQANSASQSIGSSFQQMGQKLTQAGQQMTMGITVPIAGLAAGIIKAGSDFETAFTGIQKTVTATPEQFARINDEIREMAVNIPVTREELSRIGEVAGQLGVQQEHIVDFADTVARLGVTTNLVSDQAASQFARLFNVLGIGNENIAEFGSVIVALGNNFATTEAEILDMGSRLAPVLGQFGVGAGEVLAFSTALSAMNVQAEAGGTAMARLFIRIGEATQEGGDKLARFAEVAGMSAEQFAIAFEQDAARAVEAFIVGINKMNLSGPEVVALMEELGLSEIRLRQATLALAGGAGVLTDALDLQGTSFARNDALIQESERRFGTFASQIQILKNQISEAGVEMFQSLRPALMRFVEIAIQGAEVLGTLAEAFAKLPPEIQSFVLGAAALAAVAGPAALGIGLMVTALGSLLGPIGIAVAATAALGGLVAIAVTEEPKFTSSVDAWTESIESLGLSVEDFPPPPEEKGDQWGTFLSRWANYEWDDFFDTLDRLAGAATSDEGVLRLLETPVKVLATNQKLIKQLEEMAALSKDARRFGPLDGISAEDIEQAERLLALVEEFNANPLLVEARIEEQSKTDVNEFINDLEELQRLAREAAVPDPGLPAGPPDVRTFDITHFEGVASQLRDIFAEYPELASEAVVQMTTAVLSGGADFEKAWIAFGGVPEEVMRPILENLREELQGKIVDALLGDEDISILEGQLGVVDQMLGQFGINAEGLGRISDKVKTGVLGWAEAQEFLNGAIGSSQEAISTWETDLSHIEKAMEITQRRFDEGKISLEEYTSTMDDLQGSHDRVTAGIEDDLEPAFVKSVQNRENLRKIIDETNQVIADEIAKNDDSAEGQARLVELTEKRDRTQRELTAALIGSENPQERAIGHQMELANAFGTVVGEIRALLTDLGLLDDAEADPEINVDDTATRDAIKFWEENQPQESVDIHFRTPEIAQFERSVEHNEDNITNFPQPDPTVFVSNDTEVTESLNRLGTGFTEYETREVGAPVLSIEDNAVQFRLDELEERLRQYALGQYSVTVDANIAPAMAKLGVLGQNLPESPAKEGPLSFTPDWDWMFAGLSDSADQYTNEALDHLQKFVTVSGAILDVYNQSLEFALSARGFSGRLPGLDFVKELAAFTASITAEMGFQAAQFEDAFLEASNSFNTTAQSSLSTLTEAFEAITLILEGPDIPTDIDFASRLEPLFRFIKTTSDAIVQMSDDFPPERAVLAQGFASTATQILDLVSLGASTLSELQGAQPDLGTALEAVTSIKFLIEHAMLAIGDTAAVMNSSQGAVDHPSARGEGFVGAADSFAQSSKSVLELMTAGAEFVGALSKLDRFDLDGAKEFASNLKFLIEHMMLSIGDTAAIMNSSQGSVDHPGARGEGFVGAASSFAESASVVVSLMADGLSFVSDMAAFEGEFDLEGAKDFASKLKFLIEHIMVSIGDAAQALEDARGANFLDGIVEFAEVISAATGALSDTLGFVVLLSEMVEKISLSTDDVDVYSAALAGVALRIADNFDAAAKEFEETEEGSISRLASAVGDSVGALTDVLAFHQALAEGLQFVIFSTDDIDAYSAGLAGVALEIARNFDAAAKHWEESEEGGIADLSEAVTNSTGALSEVLSFMQALSELTDTAWISSDDIRLAADRLSDIALVLAEEFADAAQDWKVEVNPAMIAFSEAVSSSTGALGEVVSFLGALKDLSEKEGSDAFGPGLAKRLVAIGTQIAEAMREAAEHWDTEADPQIKALSEDVSASASALQSVVGLLKSLSVDEDEKPIKFSAAALAPVFQGLRYIVGQFRSIAEQVSGDGVQSVVAIVEALETVRGLFNNAPQQAGDVEDAVRDWEEMILAAFQIIEGVSMQMENVLDDAEHYRDTAIAIAEAIMTGNMALASIDGLDLEGSFNANLNVPDNSGPTTDQLNNIVEFPGDSGPTGNTTVVNNSLDTTVFEQLVVDWNGDLTKKVYG